MDKILKELETGMKNFKLLKLSLRKILDKEFKEIELS
jgi:hypothetical protein